MVLGIQILTIFQLSINIDFLLLGMRGVMFQVKNFEISSFSDVDSQHAL